MLNPQHLSFVMSIIWVPFVIVNTPPISCFHVMFFMLWGPIVKMHIHQKLEPFSSWVLPNLHPQRQLRATCWWNLNYVVDMVSMLHIVGVQDGFLWGQVHVDWGWSWVLELWRYSLFGVMHVIMAGVQLHPSSRDLKRRCTCCCAVVQLDAMGRPSRISIAKCWCEQQWHIMQSWRHCGLN